MAMAMTFDPDLNLFAGEYGAGSRKGEPWLVQPHTDHENL